MKKNKITLFLMTQKGYEFLSQTIHQYKDLYELVVIGNDKAISNDYESAIIEFCIEHNLPYVTRSELKKIESEYAIAISWRWLIDHPSNKLIIFHDSILPKYRGFAPLVNMLINGEKKIGVTAIFGASKFDTGDIIEQEITEINYPITITDAIQINHQNYLKCARKILEKIRLEETLGGIPQNHEDATYSVWRDEADYQINWQLPASEICRMIDALGQPYKGAYTHLDNQIVRIFSAEEIQDELIENRDVGKVIFVDDGKPIVICGRGLVMIKHAVIENQNTIENLLPLKKFRIRFKS